MIILGVSYTVQIVVHCYFTIMLFSASSSFAAHRVDDQRPRKDRQTTTAAMLLVDVVQLLVVDGHILAELRSSPRALKLPYPENSLSAVLCSKALYIVKTSSEASGREKKKKPFLL